MIVSIGIVVSLLAGPVAPAHAAPPVAASLHVGGSAFWSGPYVASGDVPDPGMCEMAGPCWTWGLKLGRGGERLRVAIDVPARDDPFGVELIDPSGAVVASGENANAFDAELFELKPVAGTWQVRVRPTGATATGFRMRAKLEGLPLKRPGRSQLMLPDLRSVPPYEFTFAAPANPFNALYPEDNINPPLDVAGVHPVSCAVDETAEHGVSRCLRFTAGPVNFGRGPFEIHFAYMDDTTAGAARNAYQTVYRGDGSHTLRRAGTYSFHNTHMHFHYDGILGYDLYRVVNMRSGRLAQVGHGFKSGFCPADQLIGEWKRFVQLPAGTYGEGDSASGNCFSPTDGLLGLSVGWGDVYRWQRPGQLVDFSSAGDGYYVVRSTVDKGNVVLESNERNNASYALILVAGDSVAIIERGLGRDPWDRGKQVVPAVGGPLR